MNDSTARNLTRVKYAATLLGAMAAFALAPAIAHAQPVGNGADGGCHYTDKDGYDIPIDDGQSVLGRRERRRGVRRWLASSPYPLLGSVAVAGVCTSRMRPAIEGGA